MGDVQRGVNSAAVGSPVERSGTKVERKVRGETMEWKDAAKEKPENHFSVLVYGTLEDERDPDSHEGYWTGKLWQSVRENAPTIEALQWVRIPTPNV